MKIGYHDSIKANGNSIREHRSLQQLSREALVAIGERRFSEKTLARAENSEKISKEMLILIARTLNKADEFFFAHDQGLSLSKHRNLKIHHWDDEVHEWLSLVSSVQMLVEDNFNVLVQIHQLNDPNSKYHFQLTTEPKIGFEIHYIFYDLISDFLEISSQQVTPEDIVVLDIMNSTGDGRLASDGFVCSMAIENIVSKGNLVYFSAVTGMIDLAGNHFKESNVIDKRNSNELEQFLASKILSYAECHKNV